MWSSIRLVARHVATRISVGLATALLCFGTGSGRADAQPADLVVVNARVVTLDSASRTAQAVAILGGRFAAVGTDAEIRARIGPRTQVIDAKGQMVVPGLIDSHVHALGVAAAEATTPFRNLRTIAEIEDWVRGEAGRLPPGRWIWTPRVFPTRVRERRFPTRDELDAASPVAPRGRRRRLRADAEHGGAPCRGHHGRHARPARRRHRARCRRRADRPAAKRRRAARALSVGPGRRSAARPAGAGAPRLQQGRHHQRDRAAGHARTGTWCTSACAGRTACTSARR